MWRSPLKISPLRSSRPQFEMDFIAQVFKPPGQSVYGMLSLPLVKVGRPQFAIRFVAREHVKCADDNRRVAGKMM